MFSGSQSPFMGCPLTPLRGAHLGRQSNCLGPQRECPSCLALLLMIPSPPHQKHHLGAKCFSTRQHQGPFYTLTKLLDPESFFIKVTSIFMHILWGGKNFYKLKEEKEVLFYFFKFLNVSSLIIDIWILISVSLLHTIWLYNLTLYYIQPITVHCF